MFLTADDLALLTGYTRWSAQRRWLTARGYRHEVTAAGRPVVARAEVERHLVGTTAPRARTAPRLDLVS